MAEKAANTVEQPKPAKTPKTPKQPEVVTPPSARPKANLPVLASGRGIAVWEGAASTFIPALKANLTPEERRAAVREVSKAATQMDDKLNLVLGELLYEVAENNYHKDWGHKTFEAYVEEELEIKKSKAHYLKAIYKTFVVDLDLDIDKLREMEWSKAKEIRGVITKKNAKELLDKMKSMSVKQVQELVNTMKGNKPATTGQITAGVDEDKVRIVFKGSPDQAENIQEALKVAQSMTGSDVPVNNLDLICTDFKANAAGGGVAGSLGSLDTVVQNIERAYGVKLEVKEFDKARYGEGNQAKTPEAPAETPKTDAKAPVAVAPAATTPPVVSPGAK